MMMTVTIKITTNEKKEAQTSDDERRRRKRDKNVDNKALRGLACDDANISTYFYVGMYIFIFL